MTRFTYRVDGDGLEPIDAARELLEELGLLGAGE